VPNVPSTGALVAWLLVLSAVAGFLLVENAALRERLGSGGSGEVLLAEAHLDVRLQAEGHTFLPTGARFLPPSRIDDAFVPGAEVRSGMTASGGCLLVRVTYRLPDTNDSIDTERIGCDAANDPVAVATDGLGGRWVALWRGAERVEVWGDARHVGVERGQEATFLLGGATAFALADADGAVHYGPWTFEGTARVLQQGRLAWRSA